MNLVLLLVFSSVVITVTLSDEIQKCCAGDEILTIQGDTYKCVPDSTRRLQINSNKTNFIVNSRSGRCYDVFNNTFITLNVKENQVELPTGTFFPKCCPLNTVYNTKLHSCIQRRNLDNGFITETFVKVGLYNCKIVADFSLEESDDFEYKLLNSTKQIRRNSLSDYSSFCIDKNERGSYVIRECQEGFDSCDNFKCIKKCCPDGQSYVNRPKCVDSYEHGLNLSAFSSIVQNHEEDFAIIHNRTCDKIYELPSSGSYTIHRNGSYTDWKLGTTELIADMNSYCIEHLKIRNTSGYRFFHCFPPKSNDMTKFDYRLWPFLMSCVFLILTIVVYIVIREWRKMFGKILVNYCVASFFVYVILTIAQSKEDPFASECQLRAFFLIFFAVAQFSWANVMSFEIWCTFGTTKLYLGGNHREMELRKFLLYCLYGWGFALLLTLVTLLFYEWKVLPYAIQPFLGSKKCFFDVKEGNYAKHVFLNIPLLIIQIVNMFFFYKTVAYCVKVRNEINKINDGTMTHSTKKYNHDRERLFLMIKLSIVMGISYIFEVITAFFNMSELGTVPKYIEIILDIFNALQGVFIFIIFICKKKILLACIQKCPIFGIVYTGNSSSVRTNSSVTLNGVALSSLGNHNNHKLV